MAMPSTINEGNGVITATTGTTTALPGQTVGNVIILSVLQDGTGANMTLTDTNSSAEALDGTDNTLTAFPGNPYTVGNPAAAKLFLWIGRFLTTSFSADLASSGGDDLYYEMVSFQDVNTGATFASVIENGSAGTVNSAANTGTTISDVGVTTLGSDRLALNVFGINDDLTGLSAISAFTGETGGDWLSGTGFFESSTGTDGTVWWSRAQMASAGTVDGGSITITSDGWGGVGFALIGTTADAAATSDPTAWLTERRTPRRRSLQRF